jgi:hypothetical protein
MGIKDFGNLSPSFAAADPEAFKQAVQSLIFAGRNDARFKLRTKRSLIQWELPHIGENKFIEMYINPENLVFSSRKEINRVRTKGGYIAQYWGEDLDTYTISGTTGDAGIEGINVLRDVYRSEQLALFNIVSGLGPQGVSDKRRQSLMQLAASVIMWYQGQGYRGYFTDMSYTESTSKLGLFDYNMSFTVTEIIGSRRKNFLPWHRHPWSTSITPNQSSDQSISGGGYAEGFKVGVLNVPPIDNNLEVRNIIATTGENRGAVLVAILRPDSKDVVGSRIQFNSERNGDRQGVVQRLLAGVGVPNAPAGG